MLKNTYLPREEVLISGTYDGTWTDLKNDVYDPDQFRVIEPTKATLDRALLSLIEHEPLSISQEHYDAIVDVFPCLKKTKPIVTISDNPTLDADIIPFKQAIHMYRDYVSKFYGPQQLLADGVQNLSTSAGPQAKSMGLNKKSDLIEADYDFATNWSSTDDPLFFGISGKTELIKKSKYANGIIRPFEPQDARSHFECAFQFGGCNARMAEHGNSLSSPIAIGFVQQRNYIELMTYLKHQLKVFSGDTEGWDKRYEQLFYQLEFGWRLECALQYGYMTLTMETGEEVLVRLYQRIFNGYARPIVWYSPGGFLIILYIMPSGSTLTSYANSTGHSFLQFFHYADTRKKLGHSRTTFQDFQRDIMVKLYGDDNLGAIKKGADPRLTEFYTYEARLATYAKFSQKLKLADDMYSDSPVGHTWLGFVCDENMHPQFNTNKAFCSMHWPNGGLSPEERYMKAICIMLNCAYAPNEVYQEFVRYLSSLMDEYADVEFPAITSLSPQLIPTQRQLRNFWLRGESSNRWWKDFEEFMCVNYAEEEQIIESSRKECQSGGKGPQAGSQDTGESDKCFVSPQSSGVSDQDS